MGEGSPGSGLEVHRGTSALLLVAPHGGRRPPVDAAAPPPRLRVNDVYTPELTRILAERLHATVIINATYDRNGLDLNRISQVQRHAPWFLDLLAQEIGEILARHASAEIVFVHGWNVAQPKCDIGIGRVESGVGGVAPLNGATLTVDEGYLQTRVAALRHACAQEMIAAPIGERYPGSHRNNLLQLFSHDAVHRDDPAGQRIAAWVRRGRINALQLELGIPLRWPSAWRDKFVEAVVGAFVASPVATVQSPSFEESRSLSTQHSELSTAPAALQFYDPVADVGMFAGIGPMGPRSTGGRLLFFLGGQRVALFTGEDAGRSRAVVMPLEFSREGDWTRLQFVGPMLELPDAATYVDLEAALAASCLVDAAVDIRFQPRQAPEASLPCFGGIDGRIAIGSRRMRVSCGGFSNAGGLRAGGFTISTMIAAAFGFDRAVVSRATEREPVLALHFGSGAVVADAGARLDVWLDGDAYTPAALELRCSDEAPIRAQPLSRMAILRPFPGGYLRVTFGAARFRWGDAEGAGLYEHARPLTGRSRT